MFAYVCHENIFFDYIWYLNSDIQEIILHEYMNFRKSAKAKQIKICSSFDTNLNSKSPAKQTNKLQYWNV